MAAAERSLCMNQAVKKENRSAPEQRTYRADDIAVMLSISRTSAYNLIKEAHFKAVRVGNAIRVRDFCSSSISKYSPKTHKHKLQIPALRKIALNAAKQEKKSCKPLKTKACSEFFGIPERI